MNGTFNGPIEYSDSRTYDAQNRMSRLTRSVVLPDGMVGSFLETGFAYDAAGRTTHLDRFSAAESVAIPQWQTQYEYDGAGRIGDISHYNVDAVTTPATQTLFSQYSATFSDSGVITQMNAVLNAAGISATDYVTSKQFTYDSQGQVIGETGANDRDYNFDALGNRQSITDSASGTTTTSSINADNRIGSSAIVNRDGSGYSDWTFEYDNEGNLLEKRRADGTEMWSYTWDHRNRLTRVEFREDPSGNVSESTSINKTVEHEYDAFNQWIGRHVTENGVTETTSFVHDAGQISLVLDQDGNTRSRYTWGNAVDQLLAEEHLDPTSTSTIGEINWPLTDHLGSVRDRVNDNVLIDHRDYDAFGNIEREIPSATTGTVAPFFGYTARPYDEETELQNNLNRWYDSTQGRWISQDPIAFAAGDASLYRYVGNQPTFSSDPHGLFPPDEPPRERGHSGRGNQERHTAAQRARRLQQQNTAARLMRERGNEAVRDAQRHIDDAVDECNDLRRAASRRALKGVEGAAQRVEDLTEASRQLRNIEIISEAGEVVDVRNIEDLSDTAEGLLTRPGRWTIIRGGAKKILGSLPVIGIFVGVATYSGKVEGKGVLGGTMQATLEEVPVVEYAFLFGAESLIPDTKECENGIVNPISTLKRFETAKAMLEQSRIGIKPKGTFLQRKYDQLRSGLSAIGVWPR
ncbi:MAG: RHS repeat-associated core domain-containing protein [Planctomycetota bacterium]